MSINNANVSPNPNNDQRGRLEWRHADHPTTAIDNKKKDSIAYTARRTLGGELLTYMNNAYEYAVRYGQEERIEDAPWRDHDKPMWVFKAWIEWRAIGPSVSFAATHRTGKFCRPSGRSQTQQHTEDQELLDFPPPTDRLWGTHRNFERDRTRVRSNLIDPLSPPSGCPNRHGSTLGGFFCPEVPCAH